MWLTSAEKKQQNDLHVFGATQTVAQHKSHVSM